MDTSEKTLDLQGVVLLFKAEPETIAQYARSGELPGTKMGKSWVFMREYALAFLRIRIDKETEERRVNRGKTPRAAQPNAVLLQHKQRKRRMALPPLPRRRPLQISP